MTQSLSSSVPMIVEKIHPDAVIPQQGTPGATGLDVRAVEGGLIEPFSTEVFRTGLRFEIPSFIDFQVRSRSGLSAKGLSVANAPATIDSDYTGELLIVLQNHTDEAFLIAPGDRIAQIVLAHRIIPVLVEGRVEKITERGDKGLGSTGVQ